MEAIQNINFHSFLDTLISLGAAFVLGGLIGYERQYRQRTAGLRTNVLVAVGAAVFVDMANRLEGHAGAVHVIAYVVSGIGFLGAGAIMREDGNVRGLNTAATLWGSAAVGAAAGADLILEAFAATVFVLAANTLLRPIVNRINRRPIEGEDVEVTNTVYVIAAKPFQKLVLAMLSRELELANYPIRDLEVHAFGNDDIEIEAILTSTSVNSEELDQILSKIADRPEVKQAFWSPSTME
ncbi:MgtC/SapB family protein [Undibacterium rugosum]|uniref:Protein MgtC n=1 Tax=Undibacterium rugosum TaxID=2762291 RepID=A0A923KZY9_9BURK|nr:MgtC/SapB family protein [Undibacterium rugosum]MBC3936860.1 MgtC/SapB family protein [Undibacterium rugosum]MBR7780159.1 MgtC/SapB family protein [Undibacterium rugosum]